MRYWIEFSFIDKSGQQVSERISIPGTNAATTIRSGRERATELLSHFAGDSPQTVEVVVKTRGLLKEKVVNRLTISTPIPFDGPK